MIVDTKIGEGTKIPQGQLVNVYGATIGRNCMIGSFVEIQKGVIIGDNCRIQSHTFICEGVEIKSNVFVGHGVMFINDLKPKIGGKWIMAKTLVKEGASIGTNATILPVTIGKDALIGAGAVVTHDVEDNAIVKGVPAR